MGTPGQDRELLSPHNDACSLAGRPLRAIVRQFIAHFSNVVKGQMQKSQCTLQPIEFASPCAQLLSVKPNSQVLAP
jgi:hypothetical protein